MIIMKNLKGKFWTNENDMIEEFEKFGYDVLDLTYEYIEVMDVDERVEDEPETLRIALIRAKNTIALYI